MAGRKKLPDNLLKFPRKGTNKGLRKPYNTRAVEQRGITYKEPRVIKAFWKEYTMDQVLTMTDDEIIQAIDKCLDEFEARQVKNDKQWSWPINKEMLAIAPYQKK